jgi:hypothetical protein
MDTERVKMAKKTDESIFIGIDDQVIELTGKDKDAFIEQQLARQTELEQQVQLQTELKALKVSAYTKLGLKEEEINAIL